MEEIIRYKIQVKGRVQGVGFRWSAANEARNNGIDGYVKNLSNGDVYIEAEGKKYQLDAYVEWCKRGPVYGFVESVDVVSCAPVNYKEFRIER
ncbi:MAG TPA: acylphosphatase [Bacteroidales bacterium]|nr:acylphosphatase [Bacteroidales bacterium]